MPQHAESAYAAWSRPGRCGAGPCELARIAGQLLCFGGSGQTRQTESGLGREGRGQRAEESPAAVAGLGVRCEGRYEEDPHTVDDILSRLLRHSRLW